jgi:hypothetical protein
MESEEFRRICNETEKYYRDKASQFYGHVVEILRTLNMIHYVAAAKCPEIISALEIIDFELGKLWEMEEYDQIMQTLLPHWKDVGGAYVFRTDDGE